MSENQQNFHEIDQYGLKLAKNCERKQQERKQESTEKRELRCAADCAWHQQQYNQQSSEDAEYYHTINHI